MQSSSFEERLSLLRVSNAYKIYLEVRKAVVRILESSEVGASAYWAEELAGFDYLLDASPLIINKLRHHCYHITGIKVYDYRTGKGKDQAAYAEKLTMLKAAAGGDRLFVAESPELGGFGFDIGGQLVNIDTLKFFEAMIALDRANVLSDLSARNERLFVWEVGAGWGGFARVFKTVMPNTTYMIVDLPQVLLFSGVYLRANFPDAKVHFYDPQAPLSPEAWGQYDFIFYPSTALEALTPPRLDLALNMISFQEMTSEQVRGYVRHAAKVGARKLYSFNRDRSPYNTELSSVTEIIGECYDVRPIPVLDIPYTKLRMPKPTYQTVQEIRGVGTRLLRLFKGSGTDGHDKAKREKDDIHSYRHAIGSSRG